VKYVIAKELLTETGLSDMLVKIRVLSLTSLEHQNFYASLASGFLAVSYAEGLN